MAEASYQKAVNSFSHEDVLKKYDVILSKLLKK